MNDATLHFITEHENSDVFELSLQASKYPDVDMPLAVAQINGRKRVKTKIPTFYRNNQMLYPPQLSLEQASSEITAMPGFGTTDRTYSNALGLMGSLGITIREISIKEACTIHFNDIGHDMSVHDVTYENVQARERTQILMDVANKENGLVIGTGDLSELALGWATYNGDHMLVSSAIENILI